MVVEDQEGNLMNIDQFRRMGISTIDHIDTLYGKLSWFLYFTEIVEFWIWRRGSGHLARGTIS